ncbi:MAG: hypothetical protein HYT27_02930 [Parcubacteria group bacterium]|nr:hypothetical protein [Parcubacteria group bacterium]
MGSEFFDGEKKYVSSRRAAEIFGYAPDYIGQLCRRGKLECRLIGRGWFITETSLSKHADRPHPRASASHEKIEKIPITKIEPAHETIGISRQAEVSRKIKIHPIRSDARDSIASQEGHSAAASNGVERAPGEAVSISQISDNWDTLLFSENEEVIFEESAQETIKTFPYPQKIGAIYPRAFSQKINGGVYFKNLNKKNETFFSFLQFPYSFVIKTLAPTVFVMVIGIGIFYMKESMSPLLANLLQV